MSRRQRALEWGSLGTIKAQCLQMKLQLAPFSRLLHDQMPLMYTTKNHKHSCPPRLPQIHYTPKMERRDLTSLVYLEPNCMLSITQPAPSVGLGELYLFMVKHVL